MAANQTVAPPMTTRYVVSETHQPDGLIPVTPESVSQLVLEVKRLTSALEAKDAEIATKDKVLAEQAQATYDWMKRAIAAESRISDLERQLAEETERCARVAETPDVWKRFTGDFEGNCIAAAIRGGAK